MTVKEGVPHSEALADELKAHVAHKIGAIAQAGRHHLRGGPAEDALGKIMRRLLRDIAEGKTLGDTTTLADPVGGGEASRAIPGRELR